MRRRIRSKSRRRSWRFAGLVAAVAVTAFYLALDWPPSDEALADVVPEIAGASVNVPARRGSLRCVVDHVTDGDTLRCKDGTRVRLHAVAARERDGSCSRGHPCPAASAQSATAALRRLASGKTIRCEPTGRSYGRVTAICWTPGGEEINCAMVRSGTALVWDRYHRQAPLCRA